MDTNLERLDPKYTENAIEAILFAAGHPIEYSKIAEVLDYSVAQIKKKVKDFAEKYNADEKKGIMLLCFEESCQLCTKEKYLPYIKEVLGIKKGGNLSASSLEVLAIIAYNTNIRPVTRAYIDAVRGVDSSYIVASLCEKNLIEPYDRLDAPGRPHVYRTTPTFLRCFGIETLEQLPYVELPMAPSEGVIIPLEIEVPEENKENVMEQIEENGQINEPTQDVEPFDISDVSNSENDIANEFDEIEEE